MAAAIRAGRGLVPGGGMRGAPGWLSSKVQHDMLRAIVSRCLRVEPLERPDIEARCAAGDTALREVETLRGGVDGTGVVADGVR